MLATVAKLTKSQSVSGCWELYYKGIPVAVPLVRKA